MIRRTPRGSSRAGSAQRLPACLALAAVLLTQLGPVPAALAQLTGHGQIHACGCVGPICVCPHPAEARAACHLPSKAAAEDAPAFESCQEPRRDGAPPVPGVLPTSLPSAGPAVAGPVAAEPDRRAAAVPDGPDPPPPRDPSAQ